MGFKMSAGMEVGPPTLRVRDVTKESYFYTNILGLQLNQSYRTDNLDTIEFGFRGAFKDSPEPLLILKHDPQAKDLPHNFAGLYHFAILVPNRKSLASAYTAIENSETHFEGFADHLVSESLYLHDPERNGIEIYRDRLRHEWKHDREGRILMDTLPLNLESLLSEVSDEERHDSGVFPNGAKIGHIHLRVTDLERSASFYHEKLGLDISSDWSKNGAMFLSAGGYHHHVGMNIWHSEGGMRHVDGEAGLENFSISVQGVSMRESFVQQFGHSDAMTRDLTFHLVDPDGIRILIKVR